MARLFCKKPSEDYVTPHFREVDSPHPLADKPERLTRRKGDDEWENPIYHPIWTKEELVSEATHKPIANWDDRIAYFGVRLLRTGFDIFSGYSFGPINENKLLRRIIFLETVAGIPGMVAGSIRHLRSLRLIKRDHGWIHTLLEEAENERMHLLSFQQLTKPSLPFRMAVGVSQGIFWNVFFLCYLVRPKLCHSFVGYLEEEAVHTYTTAIEAYDTGLLPSWESKEAPDVAKRYWRMEEHANMRDLLCVVRADEAHHRDVNHTFADMKMDDVNPFTRDPKHKPASYDKRAD